ncbi:dGTP triphosphohydrolase [Aureitalea marina]|uniref:dGTPase n=1 Tax=Aureitalea marina TaxID=930804 RepID=A0A2S7KU16_9FLAO|nr:dNTP triphosphohydrolase [Aureitalea marina]PQB06048.1 dGTPase [Aureitalea marina]
MQWEQLLSLRRSGDKNKRIRQEQDETRLGFEVDYDRIIFSSAFRSLQDKTQVIPLSSTSFVHTRLTHSLEVSVVGRSLGRLVGQALLQRHPYLETTHGYRFNDFGAIVASAALAHDIGNPPFGHSGEKAIGTYFLQGEGQRFKSQLTDAQYQDLVDFEGNANGFRILTESRDGISGGLRLSYATLGAFMKYPKASLPKKPTTAIADKKYGVFQSELPFFEELTTELGLISQGDGRYCRHPLAYLVEAADDICYTIIDFEDGINLGWIDEEFALEYLVNLVKDRIDTTKYHKLEQRADRVSYLRSLAIGTLINEAVERFLDNEEQILKGQLNHGLLDGCRYEAQIEDILKISREKIYQSQEVTDKELSGYRVLTSLVHAYTTALEGQRSGNPTPFDSLLLRNFPFQVKSNTPVYDYLMKSCHLVSQLTDGNSLQIFHKIAGNPEKS